MMASRRPRDVANAFGSRRGHQNQLSISDSSHHITETIGTLYGDDDDYQPSESRPLSFIAAPKGGERISGRPIHDPSEDSRLRLTRTTSDSSGDPSASQFQTPPSSVSGSLKAPASAAGSRISAQGLPTQRGSAFELGPVSPVSPISPTLRDMRDGAESYPLTNMKDPNDIAQELSNLQALRRMSMDVSNHSDPDMQPRQGMSLMAMSSVAPSKDDDEADPSRLLWVPAGVHPELAPSDYQNFLEKRVQSMRRRSGESSLSVDSAGSGSLRRKKSMLSRQVDNVGTQAEKYVDGAELLERKRSTSQSDLTLDDLVNDPTLALQRLTEESQRQEATIGNGSVEDMPILPVAPGMGLRRSTRTTYRKGGSLKDRTGSMRTGDRIPFAKRNAARQAAEDQLTGGSSINHDTPPAHEDTLSRVQSEPVAAENFSRPGRSVRRQQTFSGEQGPARISDPPQSHDRTSQGSSRPAGPGRIPSSESNRSGSAIPQIVESLTEDASSDTHASQQSRQFPERSSSQKVNASATAIPEEPPARSSRRPNYGQPLQNAAPAQTQPTNRTAQRNTSGSNHTLNDIAHHGSPLPGGGATTDSLTFIPTLPSEEKKPEKKSKKDSEGGSSKSSWKWFKSDDKEKKKKDEENRRAKTKLSVDKGQDNVRLDVLQTSIDTGKTKGRDSLLMDRDSYDSKLEEERKKEGSRRSGEKKEKDGLFASFFGGSKKKGDRDSSHRKSHHARPPSPEPVPYQPLQPDVDYYWTRFPILEERAIYRMAHIKLANPRRALHSQVLLSNFMYAYLAKVQAMHPQIQVPQSPQQKRLQEEERRRQEQEQQYLEQQQAQDSIDRYNFEYHRAATQYGDSPEDGDYPEDAEIYDYEHGKDHSSYNDYDAQSNITKDYYYGRHGHEDGRRHEEQDMW